MRIGIVAARCHIGPASRRINMAAIFCEAKGDIIDDSLAALFA